MGVKPQIRQQKTTIIKEIWRNMKLGIVGLPNVGKSTLFNALTSTQNAQAANYPFCTIEPNSGIVPVPDPVSYTHLDVYKRQLRHRNAGGVDLNPNLAICSSVSPRRGDSRCALCVGAVSYTHLCGVSPGG